MERSRASGAEILERRMEILREAKRIGNVARACRELGVSRSFYYQLLKSYRNHGQEGLMPRERKKPRMPNQHPQQVVDQVFELTRRYPSYSYQRLAARLRSEGVRISGSSVRKLWARAGLTDRRSRYLWLEQEAMAGRADLSERIQKILSRLTNR